MRPASSATLLSPSGEAAPDATPPDARLWARALGAAPNAKFAATAEVYRHAGLARPRTLEALMQANIEFTYRYYVRLAQLLRTASGARLRASVNPSGSERLIHVASRGRGVMLVSAHLGDFDVVGSWLAHTLGLEVVVISDAVPQGAREAFFQHVRRSAGLLLRRRETTGLAQVQADLRAGRVVLWMLDRRPTGPAVEGSLLGQPAWLPGALPFLRRRTGCSLLPAVTTTGGDGVRSLHVGAEVCLRTHGSSSRMLDELAKTVGAGIRRAPWQWHVPVDPAQLCFAWIAADVSGAPGVRPVLPPAEICDRAAPAR